MVLNIVSFNIPYPPDYGGVIDVFYKLKSLQELGVNIILHTFEYGRKHSAELEKYCNKVYYYKRHTGIISQLSTLPYIVKSRKNKELIKNLSSNDYPILFEGIHTCYYLGNSSLSNRLKIVRTHNIEHFYYDGLRKTTKSVIEKLYFWLEKIRLKHYEKKLNFSNYIIPLSKSDTDYFQYKFGKEKVIYIPIFHQNDKVEIVEKIEKPYLLFHGNLSVAENINSAIYLNENITQRDHSLDIIIAGKDPDKLLITKLKDLENVTIIGNPSSEEMEKLVKNASINVLYTEYPAGVKIKLINSLYTGRFCLANDAMLEGSGLEDLCLKFPENNSELLKIIHKYYTKDFDLSEQEKRLQKLDSLYGNRLNAQQIIDLLQ
ncbi:glycosyltransferase [Dysgonomonas sp. 520]|uniref:glycosyltransferase n=1 Tax=Dysgonomonas sp. 520 TaxID=2302931 RepID=UPI0013D1261A|nr:glycosyltransferase [Dysgonomonas sp. 520]